jgi:hypothetical protein
MMPIHPGDKLMPGLEPEESGCRREAGLRIGAALHEPSKFRVASFEFQIRHFALPTPNSELPVQGGNTRSVPHEGSLHEPSPGARRSRCFNVARPRAQEMALESGESLELKRPEGRAPILRSFKVPICFAGKKTFQEPRDLHVER